MHAQLMANEINNAIGAHGAWKMRLRTAINTGVGDVNAADAGCDDRCSFGKWIYGSSLDAATRAGLPYQTIRRLHAEFHQAAGAVLASVERGDKTSAEALFAGDYAAKSERLVRGLTKWKGELMRGASLVA